jgi:hypothetical protein
MRMTAAKLSHFSLIILVGMSISTSEKRICECFREEIFSRDASHNLVVVVDNAKEPESQRSKQPVGSLDGGRLVDGVTCCV